MSKIAGSDIRQFTARKTTNAGT